MRNVADQQKITIFEVVDDIRETSQDEREKGDRFERAVRFFLKKFLYALCKFNCALASARLSTSCSHSYWLLYLAGVTDKDFPVCW